MHIISRKALVSFWEQYPAFKAPLARWYKIVRQTDFKTFAALRRTFPSVDKVGDHIVFDVGSNNYRLIVSIHFNRGKVYIREILTHQDYDRGGWKE